LTIEWFAIAEISCNGHALKVTETTSSIDNVQLPINVQ